MLKAIFWDFALMAGWLLLLKLFAAVTDRFKETKTDDWVIGKTIFGYLTLGMIVIVVLFDLRSLWFVMAREFEELKRETREAAGQDRNPTALEEVKNVEPGQPGFGGTSPHN